MQVKKIKIIKVSPEERKKLVERYGCRKQTIYNALGFRSCSRQAESIRQDALNEFGGIEYDKLVFY